jgi:hypothetical protein
LQKGPGLCHHGPPGEAPEILSEDDMKKWTMWMAAMALTLAAAQVWAGDKMDGKDMKDMKDMKMMKSDMVKAKKYEVVDLSCYVTKGAHGPDHKACAIKCINGGAELGLLHDGDLFIPVDKDFHSVRDKFKSKAGEMVEVKGKTMSKGGVNFLVVE